MSIDLFISHSTKDDETTTRLAEALEKNGLSVWVDHRNGIEPGTIDWEEAIRTAIIDSRAAVFLMSPQSLASQICKAESHLVRQLELTLYVARLEECKPKDVWMFLQLTQYTDLVKDFDAGVSSLLRVFRQKFPQEAVQAPKPETITTSKSPESPIFQLDTVNREAGVEANATAQLINNKFVVFEGSTAHLRVEGTNQELKQNLIDQGVLERIDKLYRFTKDVEFNTSSAAGSVIRGQNTNGPTSWRVKGQEKVTFQMWQEEKLKESK